VKDGKGTVGITPPKSNWALPVERPPFTGFRIACGITFTFGGVRVDDGARVVDPGGRALRACARRASSSAGCSSTTTPAGAA
jgi:tricarballylate dehydrogenase